MLGGIHQSKMLDFTLMISFLLWLSLIILWLLKRALVDLIITLIIKMYIIKNIFKFLVITVSKIFKIY